MNKILVLLIAATILLYSTVTLRFIECTVSVANVRVSLIAY